MLKKLIFLFILLSSFLNSENSGDLLYRVREKLDRIKPFKVEFKNQVINDGILEIEERGLMTFRDRKKIKWEYLDPDHKIWILSEDSYEYYDEEDEQITKGRLEKKTQLWIFQLLYTKELSENISLDPEKRTIHFSNKNDGADFLIFVSESFLPIKIIQKDPTGVDIVYLFSEYRINLALPDDEFKLKTDGNVDVIEFE